MKKYFIIAVAALVALASCTKSEINTPAQKEISYNAVTGKNTVTKTINDKTYYAPGDPAFGVWGLYQPTAWATDHGNGVWVGTSLSASAEITYQTDTWKKNGAVDYWPLTGSVVFMGYSPYANVSSKASVAVADSKVTLTVAGFETTTGDWVDDLMWSDAVEKSTNDTNYDADGNNTTTYNGVPIVFHHALSQIAIYAKTDKDYAAQDYTFTITALSVTVDDNATLTVADNLTADPVVAWTEPATDATRTVLSSASAALTTSFVKQGDPFLVIPQTLTAAQDIITVSYKVVHNGVTSTATKNINLTAGDSVTLSAFEKNTKYNLNLVFSLEEIKYSPDVVAWDAAVASEYEVPNDAI